MWRPKRLPSWFALHLVAIVAVAGWFEALFLAHRINFLDEGWPLYAAMRLHAGGTLYQDVFFVFPPGHLLAAWVGQLIAPPGIVAARFVYAAFNVGVAVSIYLLGRRVMPARYALLGALLIAVGTGHSHLYQYLFGYRYLVFSAAALLCFARRLDTGDGRWMGLAGVLLGISLCFRISPALAGLAAIGLAIPTASRLPRHWLRDWTGLGLGVLVAIVPTLGWLAWSGGVGPAWSEIFVRPIAMTDLQSLPVPRLFWPDLSDRTALRKALLSVEFRAFSALYAGYLIVLAGRLWRWVGGPSGDPGHREGAFRHALLLAVVLWGAIFFTRAFGRADQAHLDSALPPVCLLLAHLGGVAARRLRAPGWTIAVVAVGLSSVWLYGRELDRSISTERRGVEPFAVTEEGIRVHTRSAVEFDARARWIRRNTRDGDVILDISASPLYHAVTGRLGVGGSDLIMPGTFASTAEERAFVERLERNPPALVIRPARPFDGLPERGVSATAPAVTRWVREHYRDESVGGRWIVMAPAR